MKPAPFKYVAATTLDHALALKAEYGDEAKFLAGGQSLMPTINFRLARPAVLIDINQIDGIAGLNVTDNGTARIGALTRHRTLERDSTIAQMFPLISEAMPHVAHPQIRNRGTIGGNLSHADPASELPAIMVALGARMHVRSTSGERWVQVSEFFLGSLTTDLQPDEMLIGIELQKPEPNSGSCFMEVARRRGDFAIVGVAAMVTLDEQGACSDAKLVFCGVGEAAVDASGVANILIGHPVVEEGIRDVAAAAQGMIDPAGSVHATADYQRHVAGVLTERALKQAHARARHEH